jgi:hypothetical protein
MENSFLNEEIKKENNIELIKDIDMEIINEGSYLLIESNRNILKYQENEDYVVFAIVM